MADSDLLIEIFGDTFSDIKNQLDNLPPNVEFLLTDALIVMGYDSAVFSAELNKEIIRMRSNGMTDKAIAQALKQDLDTNGRIFGKLKNATKAAVVGSINQLAKLGQYESYDLDQDLFTWVVVKGHKVCADCESRANESPKTFSDWETLGLPGSGWSICKEYCYCILDPTGTVGSNVEVATEELTEKNAFRSTSTP